MAETESGQEKTEEATPERRQEFREKGQVAVSREISSVMVLVFVASALGVFVPKVLHDFMDLFRLYLQRMRDFRISMTNLGDFAVFSWVAWLKMVLPVFCIGVAIAIVSTLAQTRLNWSWKKLNPDFGRLNPLKGLKNMVNTQALMNTFKGIGKMLAIGVVSYFILEKEWEITPTLMLLPTAHVFEYWGKITLALFWAVSALLLVIAAVDYIYNFRQIEAQLKMSKEELKEDLKKQEVDPHVKSRMKKMQRDIVFAKTISATRDATVVITNPTHYAIALKYELGMRAPVVVAKGTDHLALQMRRVAKESGVSIVENKPLARLLHRVCEVGQQIPENLYRAVSEIIRYVFKLKGKSVNRSNEVPRG